MPPAASTTQPKMLSIRWIIFVGLLSGILVTALIWLKIPKRLILSAYGLCLVLTGVIGFGVRSKQFIGRGL